MKILILLFTIITFSASSTRAEQLPRVGGQSAWTKPKSASESKFRAVNFDDRDMALVRFKPLDQLKITELRARNAMVETKVMQIGVHRDARAEAATLRDPVLTWKPSTDGGLVARIAVTSPGARGIRAGLNVRAVPVGAEMRFSTSSHEKAAEAMVNADEIKRLSREQPVFWTPVTEGEQQIIEIYLPPGVASSTMRFSLDSVSHLIVSPAGRLNDAKLGEAQSCNRDVACSAQTPGLNKVAQSVARMVFTGQCGAGGTAATCLCTGTLLNDFDTATQLPYFFTANHCISTQSEASTLTTYWGYESSACGSRDLKNATQVTGGASFLFNDPSNDAVLLKLHNPAPAGAYFSGWDPNDVNANELMTVIHHPGGDTKKVSVGKVLGLTELSNVGGNFTTVAYTNGATQGGSSGSGLFTTSNGEYYFRGALYGGTAACSSSGNSADNANRDYYSRLNQFYGAFRSYLGGNTAGTAQGGATSNQVATTSHLDVTGAWQAQGETGWGLSIIRGASGALGVVMFHYTPSRTPIWYILLNGTFNGNIYSAQLHQFTGPGLNEGYDRTLVQSQPVGTVRINFTGTSTGVIFYDVPGVASASKNITKMN